MANKAPFADTLPPIAVSMGEPAGIGPEIILKAHRDRHAQGLPQFVVVGDAQILSDTADAMDLVSGFTMLTLPGPPSDGDWAGAAGVLTVIDRPAGSPVVPGLPSPGHAKAVTAYIETAFALCDLGRASAMVTGPIQKATLYDAGFKFAGHTEFIADLCADEGETAPEPLMLLEGGGLRVALVTIHLPLKDVSAAITTEAIVRKGTILAEGLVRDFGIERPRVAVAALNPHGGEAGALGREEIDAIAPAVGALRDKGIDARGPFPADTLFHAGARARYDAVLCMYHDQALIPLKTLDFTTGVNLTLGLPVVRASPDHGTALDIAGKGIADPSSFIAALKAAHRVAARRAGFL